MKKKLFSLLLMAGSRAWAEGPAGKYGLVGEREAVSQLTLKDDGSFEYGLIDGAADYWGKGTWRREKGAVILNSTAKEEPPFRLVRSEAAKDGGTRVWVKAANGYGVENIKVALHTESEEMEQSTSREGLAEFPSVKGKREISLRVRVYQVDMGPLPLNPAQSDFYFEINGKAITEFRFKNQRVAVNGETLELRMGESGQPVRYRKQ
jgi:hypothetical protein